MLRQPDVYLEIALLALEKLPRFLQQRSLDAYLADGFFANLQSNASLKSPETRWGSYAGQTPVCLQRSPTVI